MPAQNVRDDLVFLEKFSRGTFQNRGNVFSFSEKYSSQEAAEQDAARLGQLCGKSVLAQQSASEGGKFTLLSKQDLTPIITDLAKGLQKTLGTATKLSDVSPPASAPLAGTPPIVHWHLDVDQTLIFGHMANGGPAKQMLFHQTLIAAELGDADALSRLRKYFRNPEAFYRFFQEEKAKGAKVSCVSYCPDKYPDWNASIIFRAVKIVYPDIVEHVSAFFPKLSPEEMKNKDKIISDYLAAHPNCPPTTSEQRAYQMLHGKEAHILEAERQFIKNDFPEATESEIDEKLRLQEEENPPIRVLIDDDRMNIQHAHEKGWRTILAADQGPDVVVNGLKALRDNGYKQVELPPYPRIQNSQEAARTNPHLAAKLPPQAPPKPLPKPPKLQDQKPPERNLVTQKLNELQKSVEEKMARLEASTMPEPQKEAQRSKLEFIQANINLLIEKQVPRELVIERLNRLASHRGLETSNAPKRVAGKVYNKVLGTFFPSSKTTMHYSANAKMLEEVRKEIEKIQQEPQATSSAPRIRVGK